MSRTKVSIAVLGIVALSAAALLWRRPETASTSDPTPVSEPADAAPRVADAPPPDRRAAPAPPSAPRHALTGDEVRIAMERSQKALETAAKLRQRALFPPTSRRIDDNVDPIVQTRAVQERLNPAAQGRKPTLVVFSSALSYEAPAPIIVFARFIREHPQDWSTRTDAEIAGELRDVDGALLAQIDLRDDGQERDIEAGDGVFTTQLTPPPEELAQWNGLIRVKVYGVTSDGERRSASTRFYYGVPSARLTGNYEDRLVQGHLEVEAELDVKEPGLYRLQATLSGTRGLLAWAENTVYLEPGIRSLPLTFWGLALRQANEPGPYQLSSIALSNVTKKPPQLNDASSTPYRTAPYKPEDFSGERYDDRALLDKADRYEARARDSRPPAR